MNDRCRHIEGTSGGPGQQPAFPYVVIRHFAATYEWALVRFVEDVADWSQPGDTLLVPATHSESEASDTGRVVLVERLVDLSRSTNRRTCAAFGPDDAVYVEPTGESKASSDIPRGGLGGP